MNISDFCDMTRDVWDQKFYDIIENLVNNLFKLLEITEFFIEKSEVNLNKHKDSKSTVFKMLNFCVLMMNIGCNFEVENSNGLLGVNLMDMESFDFSRREFEVKFKNRKIVQNPSKNSIGNEYRKQSTVKYTLFPVYSESNVSSEIQSEY